MQAHLRAGAQFSLRETHCRTMRSRRRRRRREPIDPSLASAVVWPTSSYHRCPVHAVCSSASSPIGQSKMGGRIEAKSEAGAERQKACRAVGCWLSGRAFCLNINALAFIPAPLATCRLLCRVAPLSGLIASCSSTAWPPGQRLAMSSPKPGES